MCLYQWRVGMSVYKKYGIYGIVNKINSRIYVGKTMKSFGDRWDCHKAMLRGGYHENRHLQNSWNKYGEDNFDFIIIHDCKNGETTKEVDELEIAEIAKYKNLGLAYNCHDGGSGGLFLGKHLSEETKRKIGEKNRIHMLGRKASEETKKKMSESQISRFDQLSENEKKEWGKKMSLVNTGRQRPDVSLAMKNNKRGAKLTEEQVIEIRRLHQQEGKNFTEISEIMCIPRDNVYNIATYRRWKDIV